MILDSSALFAVLRGEPEGPQFHAILTLTAGTRMSAGNYVEVGILVDAVKDPVFSNRLDQVLSEYGIVIEEVTAKQAQIARTAYRNFGKGSGSKAQLNYGDCFAYALAKDTNLPLLFKGNDFRHTDILPAI